MQFNILLGIFVFICIEYVHCISEEEIEENLNAAANKALVKSACEKSKLQVVCPKGQVINIIQANYGRLKDLAKCNPNRNKKFNTKCKSSKSLTVMRQRCHLKRGCSVDATNSVFGDPCPKTIKYLEIHYKCVAATTKIPPKKVTPRPVTASKPTPKIPPKKITPHPITASKPTPKIPPKKVTPQPATTSKQQVTTKIPNVKKTTPIATTLKKRVTTKITNTKMTTPIATTPNKVETTTTPPKKVTPQPVTTSKHIITTSETTTDNPTTATTPAPEATSTHEPTPPVQSTTKEIPIISTPKPQVTAPETRCDDEDLDCIIEDLGKRPDWFICEKDMGSYPHPASKKLFIFCLNWKPSVKKCGQNRVFSKNLMTCVNP